MKTNMKNPLVKALLATFACLTFGHVTAYAAAGGSSGNGNGDTAFAFQALIDENPGLDDIEILMKAFDESAGRLPEIVSGDSAQFLGYLGFKSESEKFSGVIVYKSNKSNEIVVYKMKQRTLITNQTIDKGPLLSPAVKRYTFIFNGVSNTANRAYLSKSGIVISNSWIATDQKIIEVRQFSSNILIYAIFATNEGASTKCRYNDDAGMDGAEFDAKDLVPGQICAIGYSWKSK